MRPERLQGARGDRPRRAGDDGRAEARRRPAQDRRPGRHLAARQRAATSGSASSSRSASSELSHDEPTSVALDGRTVGGGATFCLIAGPCTVESRDQTLGIAAAMKSGGASMLRGGAFKPRTSPFSFRGLGTAGLDILREAREQTGLPVVSELTDASHADEFAESVDVVQVGARNMQNYALFEIVGKLGKPVLPPSRRRCASRSTSAASPGSSSTPTCR